MPIASTMANRVVMLTVKPSAAMAAKAPMIVTGTVVVAGTSMARQSCRNTDDDQHQDPASISVLKTSLIEALTKLVVSNGTP